MIADSASLAGHINKPDDGPQWLRFGLPVKKGLCDNANSLQLVSASGEAFEADVRPVTRWHDGSLQWVIIDLIANNSEAVFLRRGPNNEEPSVTPQQSLPAGSKVSRGNGQVGLNEGINAELRILVGGSLRSLSVINEQTQSNSLCLEHNLSFAVDGVPDVELSLQVTEVLATGQTELKPRVHNRAASLHPNGCWDLGDPNSVYINSLSLTIVDESASQASLVLRDQTEPTGHEKSFPGGLLKQYGSGGEHWDSPAHVDKTGVTNVKEQGYKLFDAEGVLSESGLRASPRVRLKKGGAERLIIPRQFWENCPSALELSQNQATWQLFPEETELQPGESKTWVCDLASTESRADFRYKPAYIDATCVMLGCKLSIQNELSTLLDSSLSGPTSFFSKREACDEYGWRNFGELYADHEALNVNSESIFVSHYNNQYDPVWGFSLRYLSIGDDRWQELASDLARHVVDIDIYKTDRDKAEYNNGLFWHTDHYLLALTATHRTYSSKHEYAYEGHQGGGGPGGQHCYTSGLTIRYLLSGDAALKQSVIGLSHWVRFFYNGAPGLLARLHRFLTVDLKSGKMTNVGYIDKGYKYPLDRGTGHYLNALIDAYLVQQDSGLLNEMHGLIVETLSPHDDLAERDLANVEERWFYIVFLQSLARYLLLKEQLGQPDPHYAYARHTLIHYADWVLKNEKTYLSNPGALEFPTDTWAAQDIRKANVLYYAAYFNPEQREPLARKADEFWQYCVETLVASPERHTTRVQAIVAQNLGVREWFLESEATEYPLLPLEGLGIKKPGTGERFSREALSALRCFSFSNEVQWLKSRLSGR